MHTGYRPEIDGLRAFAVLAVFFYHLDFPWAGGGFIGVDVFFVISGFLITRIVRTEIENKTFSFANFYARRIKRIFPALFTVLLVSSLAAFLLLDPPEYRQFFRAAKYASLQVSNFFFLQQVDYFDQGQAASALLHTWSLGVEEQFYLFLPLFLFAAAGAGMAFAGRRFFILAAAVLLISLIISEVSLRLTPQTAFYMLHTRAWEMGLGALLGLGFLPSLASRRAANICAGLALLTLIAVAVFYDGHSFPGLKALLPCTAAALFIYAAQNEMGFFHRLLAYRPIVFIGLISYSLYLWHWPLIAFYKSYTGIELTLPVQLSLLAAALLLSVATYRWIETPLRYGTWAPRKVLLTGMLVMAMGVALTSPARDLTDSGLRTSRPIDADFYKYSPLAQACFLNDGPITVKSQCVLGNPQSSKRALLLGDSHAGHYAEPLAAWAHRNDVALTLLLTNGCVSWLATDTPQDEENCRSQRRQLQSYMQDLQQRGEGWDYIFLGMRADQIFTASAADAPAVWQNLRLTFDGLAGQAKNIVVLGQVPLYPADPLSCYFKQNLHISRFLWSAQMVDCTQFDAAYSAKTLEPIQQKMSQMAADYGVRYFDPTPTMFQAITSARGAQVLLYKDRDHLNVKGAAAVTSALMTFLQTP